MRVINYDKYGIPDHMWEGIDRYVEHGIAGDFLKAVICNDLRAACERADDINRHRLFNYVNLMYNEFPAGIWGSEEKYREHVRACAANRTKRLAEAAQGRPEDSPSE